MLRIVKRWVYWLDAVLRARFGPETPWVRWLLRPMRSRSSDAPRLAMVRDLPMYVRPHTFETISYLCSPFEPYTTDLLEQAVTPGATVVDIGAQFGYFSLLAAKRVGSQGRVLAFEPAPANLELLRKNIMLNRFGKIIQAFPHAVGDQHATLELFVYEGSDSHSLHQHPKVVVKERRPVECVTLDAFLPAHPIDVMKIDIEGHEPFALRGMTQTITQSPQLVLFVEYAPAYLQRAGVNPTDYIAQLEGLGFTVQLIDEVHRRLNPISEARIPEDPNWHANLYCTKRR